MSTTERCDEIIRLIDQVLAETGAVPPAAPGPVERRRPTRLSSASRA